MLAESASATKKGGQELIGGLHVKVQRNSYGRQTESFVADLDLPFLSPLGLGTGPFRGVFIRAPVVEEILQEASDTVLPIEILGILKRQHSSGVEDQDDAEGRPDIVAVTQGNILGTSFHPELTDDIRIHLWWLRQVADIPRGAQVPS